MAGAWSFTYILNRPPGRTCALAVLNHRIISSLLEQVPDRRYWTMERGTGLSLTLTEGGR